MLMDDIIPMPISTNRYIVPGMKTNEEAFFGDTFYAKGLFDLMMIECVNASRSTCDGVARVPGPKAHGVRRHLPHRSSLLHQFNVLFMLLQSSYEPVASAIGRLALHDSGVFVRKDNSVALGAGWRIGLSFSILLSSLIFDRLSGTASHGCVSPKTGTRT
jgi:hypothetical protein